jgi:hypothetical protein
MPNRHAWLLIQTALSGDVGSDVAGQQAVLPPISMFIPIKSRENRDVSVNSNPSSEPENHMHKSAFV